MSSTVLITGAYGYLGSRIRAALDDAGWSTIALTRNPRQGDQAIAWGLGEELPGGSERRADVLVHCAYDMTVRRWDGIHRVNIDGSAVLLRSARRAGIERLLVLSSMSAYAGTHQKYGRAKLEIERITLECGGIAVRPGLVYGEHAGGMTGTLRSLTKLPVTPVLTGGARQFPVEENDFVRVILRVLTADPWTPEVFGIAQPVAVRFRRLMQELARRDGRTCRMVPVPWQAVFVAALAAEVVIPRLGIRADSVKGLVHPAPSVPRSLAFPGLLDTLTRIESSKR